MAVWPPLDSRFRGNDDYVSLMAVWPPLDSRFRGNDGLGFAYDGLAALWIPAFAGMTG